MNWSIVIPDLFYGRAKSADNIPIGEVLNDAMLRRLTGIALKEAKNVSEREDLRSSLRLDGFDV